MPPTSHPSSQKITRREEEATTVIEEARRSSCREKWKQSSTMRTTLRIKSMMKRENEKVGKKG